MTPSPTRKARGVLRRALERVAPTEVRTALRFLRARGGPAFPPRRVEVTARLPPARVLVLAPHPDDEAIGLGGTLIEHVRSGSPVTVLYLTDGAGAGSEREELVAVRKAEAEAFGRALGIEQVFWTNADTALESSPALVEAMAGELRRLRPEIVYAPSFFDRHYDHFTTGQVLVEAVERSGHEATIAGYEVWDPVAFPNWVVDVSRHQEEKEELLSRYATPMRTTDFAKLCRYRSSVHYTLAVNSHRDRQDLGFAEAFLRLDARTYAALHRGYVEALRASGSPLVERLR